MEKGCGFFSWDHSKTEVAAEETCEHLQAGSPLHPPQGLHKLRGLEKQTADPQLGSETTRNACTGLLNPASPNMRAQPSKSFAWQAVPCPCRASAAQL